MKPTDPNLHLARCLNKWVVQHDDDPTRFTGLTLAETREDAEDWQDELAIPGTLMTMEEFEANTPEGQNQKAARDQQAAKRAQRQSDEDARKARAAQMRADRQASRGGNP